MTRESNRKDKIKNPKFKDTHDADVGWEELREIQKQSRKIGKKPSRKENQRDKW